MNEAVDLMKALSLDEARKVDIDEMEWKFGGGNLFRNLDPSSKQVDSKCVDLPFSVKYFKPLVCHKCYKTKMYKCDVHSCLFGSPLILMTTPTRGMTLLLKTLPI